MDSEELLEQLADIHLPTEISYWPPAPGWWILGTLVVIGVIYLLKSYLARRHLQRVAKAALTELDNCYENFSAASGDKISESKLRYVNEVNSVLRRVALVHYPQSKVASLGGSEWVDFIKEKGDSNLLSGEIAKALGFGRFQTECEFDVNELNELGHAWISSLYLNVKNPKPTAQEITN